MLTIYDFGSNLQGLKLLYLNSLVITKFCQGMLILEGTLKLDIQRLKSAAFLKKSCPTCNTVKKWQVKKRKNS